ncbi:uncharacterized protein V1510DRAFT_301404 [Dipodascopsis tothii]|uniref:uncharacterized protein n=1 Tax=Dipodascopsis tothii TaxID=44089 RepID=UPI0034CE7A59
MTTAPSAVPAAVLDPFPPARFVFPMAPAPRHARRNSAFAEPAGRPADRVGRPLSVPSVPTLSASPLPALPALPAAAKVQAPTVPMPARTHVHRRSAAISQDFLADLNIAGAYQPRRPERLPSPPADEPPASPPSPAKSARTAECHSIGTTTSSQSRSSSPCLSSSLSIVSSSSVSSLTSEASATSTSSQPARGKVAFSHSVEFIPTHSTSTSTSTVSTATITPSPRASPALPAEEARPRRHKHTKVKSWAGHIIRFRTHRRSSEELRPDATDRAALQDEAAYFKQCRRARSLGGESSEDDSDGAEGSPVPDAFAGEAPATPPATPPRGRTPLQQRAGNLRLPGRSTPEPVIDLDAALGPFCTPPLLGSQTAGFSFTGTSLPDPVPERGFTRHRRSESAPETVFESELSPVGGRTFPLPSSGSTTTLSTATGWARSSRGMKRKMSSVVEISGNTILEEESEVEDAPVSHISAEDSVRKASAVAKAAIEKSSALDFRQPSALVERPHRRSVWEEFVQSFGGNSEGDLDEFALDFGMPGPAVCDDGLQSVDPLAGSPPVSPPDSARASPAPSPPASAGLPSSQSAPALAALAPPVVASAPSSGKSSLDEPVRSRKETLPAVPQVPATPDAPPRRVRKHARHRSFTFGSLRSSIPKSKSMGSVMLGANTSSVSLSSSRKDKPARLGSSSVASRSQSSLRLIRGVIARSKHAEPLPDAAKAHSVEHLPRAPPPSVPVSASDRDLRKHRRRSVAGKVWGWVRNIV